MPTTPSGDTPSVPDPSEREDDLRDAIVQAQRGDVVAFNLLVERFQRAAYSVALRMMGHPEQAADVTQDAILAAYRGIGHFRGGDFRVWLLRIVTNRCLDALRKRKRHPTVSLDELLTPVAADGSFASVQASAVAALSDDAWDPAALAESHELHDYLQRGLASLPEDQRIAVILSDVEGLSYEEIAEITQANLGTVKSRISRGRARLRDYLRQHPELLPPNYRQSTRTDPPAPFERGSSQHAR